MAVSLERAGSVGVIHLNRPPANSYDKAFLDELNGAIDAVRFDEELRAAVLVSDLPRFFSAGADVAMFQAATLPFKRMLVLHAHETLRKMEHTPKVFLAAIGGHCLGGGLEIALACDRRIAAEGDYRLGLPEATLGLLPGNGGTQRLSRLIGRAKALDLMVRGASVGPAEALALGLVDELVPAGALVERAVDYAQQLAAGPALAIGNIKLAAVLGSDLPLEGGLALERELVHQLFASADAAEGLAAFREKRPPVWTGR